MVRYLGNSAPQVIGTNFENTQSNLRLKFDQSPGAGIPGNVSFQYRTTANGAWLYQADSNYTNFRTFDWNGLQIRIVREMNYDPFAHKITGTYVYATDTYPTSLYISGTLTSGSRSATGLSSNAEVTTGVLSQGGAGTIDVDLVNTFPSVLWYYNKAIGSNLLDIKLFGQYIKDPGEEQKSVGGATANQSHLIKCFIQQFWANNTNTWAALGGNVYASLSTDATNFPAGAINVAKVQVISNASAGTILRLTNRTTPASSSVTYWAYSISNLRN